jgi:hypothetical protein
VPAGFEDFRTACYERDRMKKFLILTGGWTTLTSGVLLLPIPLPLPFPAGPVLVLIGCAILTPHSKTFRRGVQRIRFRYGWLSRGMDKLTLKAPRMVKSMLDRTSPLALERYARLRALRVPV